MGIWDISVTLDPSILSKSNRKSKSNHPMVQTARCVKWAGVVQNRARKLMLIVTKTVPSCTRALGRTKFWSMGKIALKKGKIAYYKFHPLDSHRKKQGNKCRWVNIPDQSHGIWNDVWINKQIQLFGLKQGEENMEWIYRIPDFWTPRVLNTSGILVDGWWHQKVGVGIKGPGWF